MHEILCWYSSVKGLLQTTEALSYFKSKKQIQIEPYIYFSKDEILVQGCLLMLLPPTFSGFVKERVTLNYM